MNTSPKNRPKTQPSILDFINHPNYTTAKSREPRSLIETYTSQQRGSSLNSCHRKRKLSVSDQSVSDSKILIMESTTHLHDNPENTLVPSCPPKSSDLYTTALLEMEMRLTQSMQDMIAPLKTSINSLVVSQQDWEQQKNDVQLLHAEKDHLNIKIQEVKAKNNKLEKRVKKLDNHLMENNLILHGVHEGKWELDSTRNELVIQAISNTVEADSLSNKLEIARKIPITSTSQIGKYNPSRS